MRNALQDQLLKAGLAKKHQVDKIVREKNKQQKGKAAPANSAAVDAAKLQAERAERDRALAAERNAQLKAKEQQAQVRQIIASHALAGAGDIEYRFVDAGVIRSIEVDVQQRNQLAKGVLVIARDEQRYALLPRAVAERIIERGGVVVVDHAASSPPGSEVSEDDEHYRQFVVPDDLVW